MYKKQAVLLLSVLVMMCALLSLRIHKAGVPSKEKENRTGKPEVAHQLSDQEVLTKETALLSSSQLGELNKLDSKPFQPAEYTHFWNGTGRGGAAGLYLLKKIDPKSSDVSLLIAAGEAFQSSASDSTQIELSTFYLQKATSTFQRALTISPDNLRAKTGLGVCYVLAGTNPMAGITLLLEVVRTDSLNVAANYNLGLFSMKTGQFEKSIARFKRVIKVSPVPSALIFLAESYEKSGDTKKALAAYKESLTKLDKADKTRIDNRIRQLTQTQ